MRVEDELAAASAEGGRPAGGIAAPLLPASARRPAALLAGSCLVLVVVLGVVFAHQARPQGIDQAVYSWLLGLHIPLGAFAAVSRLGGLTATAALTAALTLGCLAVRRLRAALLALGGMALSFVLTEWVIKPAVDRTITVHHYVTYPSGHTTALFALSTALAVVLLSAPSRPRWRAIRAASVVVAVIVSCAVGAAMIAQDFHYFTDAVGGAAVGTGAVITVAFLLDLAVSRRLLSRLGR